MEIEELLDSQVCFALYSASRVASNAYRDGLAALGLTYTQYVTLLALWERDGISVSALGERLRLDSGTLSPLIRRLEAMDLVERRRDQADERMVTVHVTDSGRALRPRVSAVQREVREKFNLSPDEAVLLRDLAKRFCDAHE
ncbi:Transcriptional regulator, MarR family OS=Tsukamurella paurometabola (strain ATCC 8368 / DSM/ CCUG 35730 / CIP 100753 / JCM 10117 / KCTC 9821 / NBRC 16120/ NCIMB 702349 / NCTC 13040) OX=521096 GN=Tpau_2751 PE=4 SV=1 [Tsukamurella paurometabola]|uniref:Transcriptional regulator, MarR family n=1 Tax=Tsukamurella paurometabola (strain ATCC 8368 / DSM 20162 / CCUG 35730 / CIP 100753 / JCM 10117 / KCTC 9821 / NBRC 16120 / NCIMB 702349 / NCTC 13040) TaxID=521096 RepID=D5USS8_TSUPD|nr:MarR family transcriptional regulator [Tsukamurella paurometabola]ADG79349.1 transcriptional regulator, MarR family [Tsukamurella paurometabola DSM 20162]SUP35196.1 Organic hydroperoxide resistance transcriptional regulator [Tsukamurella paurometabola]